jgi:nitroreductase
MPTLTTPRKTEYAVDPMFVNRWSPRAMSGEPIYLRDLMSLIEAARWAPSSYNNQPWRFIYAQRDTPEWDTFFKFLVPQNQVWAKNAAALIVITSRKTMENGKPAPTHQLDTGAAWMSLALEGSLRGLVVHGMQGFDAGRARTELGIPGNFDVLAMAAIGKPGRKEDLPKELQEREAPSDRKKIAEIAFEGKFLD